MVKIQDLIGETMSSVKKVGDDVLSFTTNNGRIFEFYHSQDCCEMVYIDDIVGDLDDLVGNPIIIAEDVSSEAESSPKDVDDYSFTWTFYKFSTIKGSVTVKWYGTSNGYYSESVDLREVK